MIPNTQAVEGHRAATASSSRPIARIEDSTPPSSLVAAIRHIAASQTFDYIVGRRVARSIGVLLSQEHQESVRRAIAIRQLAKKCSTGSSIINVYPSSLSYRLPMSSDDSTYLASHRWRMPDRGSYDSDTVNSILDEGLMAHVGLVAAEGPVVIPMIYGRRPDMYLHGSPASRLHATAVAAQLCVTVSLIDGLVVARSLMHHSMNYRAVVLMGEASIVDDFDEKTKGLLMSLATMSFRDVLRLLVLIMTRK